MATPLPHPTSAPTGTPAVASLIGQFTEPIPERVGGHSRCVRTEVHNYPGAPEATSRNIHGEATPRRL
jgi:hypothetical protein